MSRTGYEKEMQLFKGLIGKDEFGINRIYVDIKDIPEDMLKELKGKMNFECSDCGSDVVCLVINMQGFVDRDTDRRGTNTDMFFDCGVCAVGG